MKIFIVFAVLVFSVAHAGKEDWKVCSEDSDCDTTTEVCGACTSINKKFRGAHDRLVDQDRTSSLCAKNPESKVVMNSKCVAKTCQCVPEKP